MKKDSKKTGRGGSYGHWSDFIGKTLGDVEILRRIPREHRAPGAVLVEYRCHRNGCGRRKVCQLVHIVKGNIKSCGCRVGIRWQDRIGTTINGIKVLAKVSGDNFRCRCHCGRIWVTCMGSLTSGLTTSCRCTHQPCHTGSRGGNRVLSVYRHRAKREKHEWSLGDAEFLTIVVKPCAYCGVEPQNISRDYRGRATDFKYSGIDRVDNSLGYTSENSVPCCIICNKAKRDLSKEDFLKWITRAGYYQMSLQDAAQ